MSDANENRLDNIDARIAALFRYLEEDRVRQQQRDEAFDARLQEMAARSDEAYARQQQQNETVNAQIAALFRHSDEAWVRDQQRFGLINAQFEEVGNHLAELTVQVSSLVDTVQNLTGRMDQAFEQADRDRTAFEEESRRIWAYLQGRNGNQGN